MSTDATRLTSALTGRHRLERELGQCGMATVYLAHDLRHDRKVALKVLRPELSAILGAERQHPRPSWFGPGTGSPTYARGRRGNEGSGMNHGRG